MEDNGLILGLLKTYEDPEPRFADFAIHCTGPKGEETVWCHKILLVLRSGYFDGLLRMEPETKSISLPDFSFEVVKAVVKSAIAVDEEELTKVGLIGKGQLFIYFMTVLYTRWRFINAQFVNLGSPFNLKFFS